MIKSKNIFKTIAIVAFSIAVLLLACIKMNAVTVHAEETNSITIDAVYIDRYAYGSVSFYGHVEGDISAVLIELFDASNKLVAVKSGAVKVEVADDGTVSNTFEVLSVGSNLPNGLYRAVAVDYETGDYATEKTFNLNLTADILMASLIVDANNSAEIGLKLYLGVPFNYKQMAVNGKVYRIQDLLDEGILSLNIYGQYELIWPVDAKDIGAKINIDFPEEYETEIIGSGDMHFISYSVRDYIEGIYDAYESEESQISQETYELCKAIDALGYSAENYFSGKYESNELIEEIEDMSFDEALKKVGAPNISSKGNMEYLGNSLILRSMIGTRFYFMYDGQLDNSKPLLDQFCVFVNGEYVEGDEGWVFVPEGDSEDDDYEYLGMAVIECVYGNVYYLEIEGMNYTDFERIINIDISPAVYSDNDDKVIDTDNCVEIRDYSILSYLKALDDINKGESGVVSNNNANLWKALYNVGKKFEMVIRKDW